MRTRSRKALPLDDDLIDQILTFLPSFADLRSAILSSNTFYGVFSARPSSIVEAVAYNEVGPALSEALRVFRYKGTDPWSEDVGGLSSIMCTEARSLTRNTAAVKGLEDIFSSRYKDRSSKTSRLNFMESWRFHRAMHTLTLFTAIFPGNELYHERDVSNIQRKQAERTAFLTHFSSNELSEIYSASRFLVVLLRWSVIAREGDGLWDRRAYSAWATSFGPSLIWRIYSEAEAVKDIGPDMEEASENTLDSYISPSISAIWDQRKEGPPKFDFHWISILDENYGDRDKCQMCQLTCGHNRWNETNWDELEGILSIKLAWSHFLLKAIRAQGLLHLLDGHLPNFTFSTLLREMHEIPPGHLHPQTWKKDDWLCLTCINQFFEARLGPWLLRQKRLAGQTIQPNCQDGYNCEIQGVGNHGEKFNHLCEPLPKDGREDQGS